MNHKKISLGIAAIAAVVALAASAFVIPQQALAHYNHHHHHNNGIKVDQNILQENFCNSTILCHNNGNNSVDIDR
jgi:hypothetical protein